jgi:hypothetical protein
MVGKGEARATERSAPKTAVRPLLRGDGAGGVVRRGECHSALSNVRDVCREGLFDPAGYFFAGTSECDDARHVWDVGTPAAVFGLFVDDYVLVQRSSFSPLARWMLPRVPAGIVSLSLPATTMRSGRSGCAHTSCEPRCLTTVQPASWSAARTSRYLFRHPSRRYGRARTSGCQRDDGAVCPPVSRRWSCSPYRSSIAQGVVARPRRSPATTEGAH